jgi:isocitrate dehydrogenase (NAD+)
MAYDVVMIPGDGIGPELSEATRRVLDATGVDIRWEMVEAGAGAIETYGTPLPEPTLAAIRRAGVAIKGPVTTPVGKGFRSVNVALRRSLDLYACLRPCRSYAGARTRFTDIDLVVVRENTEDLYAGVEFARGAEHTGEFFDCVERLGGPSLGNDAAVSIKYISETGTKRIAKYAFEYARAKGRRKVTAVHKANIMKASDGLFLAVAEQVAKEYPDIEFDDRIVDNMSMQLVQKPETYDVLLCPNLYGDILSDLCAGLIGGLGLAPGANIGEGVAVFEAVHGSAPKYAGMNKSNPMALMLSGVLMLDYLGERGAAERLERAISEVIAEGRYVTYDMKAQRDDPTAVGTSEVADAVIARMQPAQKS